MSTDLFADLTVIDCASFIAGPAAGTIMADFGARVIKVEPPGAGDSLRLVHRGPGFPASAHDYFWLVDNRSKDGLALDLKHPDGHAVLCELVAKADVFITNFPGPIRQRLRLSPQDLMPLNDRLIYASLTPYGEAGPERDNTGYDATAWWARSGMMDSVRASADTPPAFSVAGMGDHPTAVALYGAIVSALYRRTKTGKGGFVSTSLLANGLWSMASRIQGVICGTEFPEIPKRGMRGPLTEFYRCRDGRWFMLAILNQVREWPLLAQVVGHPELLDDPRYATSDLRKANGEALLAVLESAFATRDWQDWKQALDQAGITTGAASLPQDHLTCPQVAANNMLPEMADHSGLRTIDSPIHIEGEVKRPPARAPEIGEHSQKVLADFGYSTDQIDRLVNNGAVGLFKS